MLVMNELFDCWRSGKSSMDYHLYFEDWWERDTTATVLRDQNHPSVFIWSCGNEIAESNGSSHGEYWLKQLVDTIHMLGPDPSGDLRRHVPAQGRRREVRSAIPG